MKKLLSLTLTATLLLTFAACGKPAAPIPNPPLVLGEKYLFDQDYEQALLQFDQAIVIEPKNPRGYLGKYATLEFLNRHDEAVQTLQEAKKKAGGDEIKATLAAAAISAEDGLVAAAEAYKGIGFKDIALLLLKLCVEVYQGTERFVAALSACAADLDMSEYTTAAASSAEATTRKLKKLDDYFVAFKGEWGMWEDCEDYVDFQGHNRSQRWVQTSANTSDAYYRLMYTEHPPLWPAQDDEPGYGFYYGWGAYFTISGQKLHEITASPSNDYGISWTSSDISFFGIYPGLAISDAEKIVQHTFGEKMLEAWGEVADDFVCDISISGEGVQIDDTSFVLGFNVENGIICEIVFMPGYLIG